MKCTSDKRASRRRGSMSNANVEYTAIIGAFVRKTKRCIDEEMTRDTFTKSLLHLAKKNELVHCYYEISLTIQTLANDGVYLTSSLRLI